MLAVRDLNRLRRAPPGVAARRPAAGRPASDLARSRPQARFHDPAMAQPPGGWCTSNVPEGCGRACSVRRVLAREPSCAPLTSCRTRSGTTVPLAGAGRLGALAARRALLRRRCSGGRMFPAEPRRAARPRRRGSLPGPPRRHRGRRARRGGSQPGRGTPADQRDRPWFRGRRRPAYPCAPDDARADLQEPRTRSGSPTWSRWSTPRSSHRVDLAALRGGSARRAGPGPGAGGTEWWRSPDLDDLRWPWTLPVVAATVVLAAPLVVPGLAGGRRTGLGRPAGGGHRALAEVAAPATARWSDGTGPIGPAPDCSAPLRRRGRCGRGAGSAAGGVEVEARRTRATATSCSAWTARPRWTTTTWPWSW